MKEIMTKSGKASSQVLEEARKFCELNESPKTFENIKNIISGNWVQVVTEPFSASEKGRKVLYGIIMKNTSEGELRDELVKRAFLVKNIQLSNICAEGERGVPKYVKEEIQEVAIDIAMTMEINKELLK